jgi:tRNA (cmo5U34)-methyltransferase
MVDRGAAPGADGDLMSGWTENDSLIYREIAEVAVPRRREMIATLVAAVPFSSDEPLTILELGSGDGGLAEALLTVFPRATLTALDGSASMREESSRRLTMFGDRARVAAFDVAALDWWDRMFGVDLIVSSLTLHHLNDAKKQYVYKAAAERLSPRGALIVADLIDPQHPAARRLAADQWDALARSQAEALGAPQLFARFLERRWNHFRFPDDTDQPAALFHQLMWLRHAGFSSVDCCWLTAGHAVFGGFKQAGASAPPPRADS